jgi:K+-transporting ATPase ATPase C chain
MKAMTRSLRPALLLLLSFTLLTGILYPLAITVLAKAFFPRLAAGSIIERRGGPVGSALIGQPFDDPRYFWGRPSALSPIPCDPLSSGGSNLGPTNPLLVAAVRARVAAIRDAHAGIHIPVPVDLVTTSGSGLDPHISPAAAAFQVPRVASERHVAEAMVRALVATHTEGRQLGVLGEPRVNVLMLNLALDGVN